MDLLLKVLETIDEMEETVELREDQKEMLHASIGALIPFFYSEKSKEELNEFKKLHGIGEIMDERFEPSK